MVFFKGVDDVVAFAEGSNSVVYYSDLPHKGGNSKEANLVAWDKGEKKVLSATSAVCQGLDRPHIRFVVFYRTAYGMLGFAQGAGWASHAGQFSDVILIRDTKIVHVTPGGPKSMLDLTGIVALDSFVYCRAKSNLMCRCI